jgi:preprotein translocase subunit SecG
MVTLVTIIHVIVCLFLILVILLQAGKGGGMGAAFGGAGTQTVFGGRGAATFLSKVTSVMAFMFVFTSLVLAYWASHHDDKSLKRRSAGNKGQKQDAKGGLGTKKQLPVPVKVATPPPAPKKVQVKVPEKAQPPATPEKAEPKAAPKAAPKPEPKPAEKK